MSRSPRRRLENAMSLPLGENAGSPSGPDVNRTTPLPSALARTRLPYSYPFTNTIRPLRPGIALRVVDVAGAVLAVIPASTTTRPMNQHERRSAFDSKVMAILSSSGEAQRSEQRRTADERAPEHRQDPPAGLTIRY